MQVTSLLSRGDHEHPEHPGHHDHEGPHAGPAESCTACGHDHEHIPVRLTQTIIGMLFIINAFIIGWVFPQGAMVSSASAMIGAILLGYPIVLTALKDLRRGILSINEL